jgi:hypothetical protein
MSSGGSQPNCKSTGVALVSPPNVAVNLSDADLWLWMNNTRKASVAVMLGLLNERLPGEPALV